MILECYIQAFARACAKAGGWFGLDLFAGTGVNYSCSAASRSRGSPLILLDAEPPPATKVLLCEQHDGADRLPSTGARRTERGRTFTRATQTPSSTTCS